jgi:hypothetical protein
MRKITTTVTYDGDESFLQVSIEGGANYKVPVGFVVDDTVCEDLTDAVNMILFNHNQSTMSKEESSFMNGLTDD